MNTGILVTAMLWWTVGQTPVQTPNDGAIHRNTRNLRIPVTLPEETRKDLKEILLYVSTDQGANWQQAGRITADKNEFALYASQDGPHWLRIAVVDRNGKQEPDDKEIMTGKPHMKLVIDTRPPIIRMINAQRQGEDILVNWELQEDNFDKTAVRLEYQIKDSPAETWTPIPAQIALTGQTAFRPGTNQALKVRITVRDLAKNESFAFAEVAGSGIATTSYVNPASLTGGPLAVPPPMNVPTLPGQLQVQMNPPPPVADRIPPPTTMPEPYKVQSPSTAGVFPPSQGFPPPPPPAVMQAPPEKVVADSRLPQKPVAPPSMSNGPGGIDLPAGGTTLPGSMPARKPLPELLYVNNHQITLDYEVRRVGPSGVGGIQVWLTRDDGLTWEPFAENAPGESEPTSGRNQRKFEFRDASDIPFPDGIYGMALVVKSRAGLSNKPQPGTPPQVRVEIDTQAPVAVLYQPMPDPQHPELVLLKWKARDKNLTQTPIQLEYAEKNDGPWVAIKLDHENKGRYTNDEVTGDFSWKVPEGCPARLYLRLRVQDKAGNESIAVTPEAQFVDLTIPDGALIGVQPFRK